MQIEWLYGGEKERQPPPQSAALMVFPPPEELLLLEQAAMIGDIMDIREHVRALAHLAPELQPFVAKLKRLADNLDILGIQKFLKHEGRVT